MTTPSAVAFAFDSRVLVVAVREVRRWARAAGTSARQFLSESSDTTLKTALFEDSAAITGVLIAMVRMIVDEVTPSGWFPGESLSVLLYGPTMSIVLPYAIMSIPLYDLGYVTLPMLLVALLAITASVLMARALFSVLVRFTYRYYAAVIATAFLALTTAWGPVAMIYLHRVTEQRGPVEPMPVALPLNAFYAFPWIVSLLPIIVLTLFA